MNKCVASNQEEQSINQHRLEQMGFPRMARKEGTLFRPASELAPSQPGALDVASNLDSCGGGRAAVQSFLSGQEAPETSGLQTLSLKSFGLSYL